MATEYGTNAVKFENCGCIRETDKAILVVIDGIDTWIPKNQIHDDSEVFNSTDGGEGDLIVTRWIAEQKGLV